MSPSAQAEQELDRIVDAALIVPIDDVELRDEVLEGRSQAAILFMFPCRGDEAAELHDTALDATARVRGAIFMAPLIFTCRADDAV